MRKLLLSPNIVITQPTDEELEDLILCGRFDVQIAEMDAGGFSGVDWGDILSLSRYVKKHKQELYRKYRLLLE